MLTYRDDNPCGLRGLSFIQLAAPDPEPIHRLLLAFGFSRTMRHAERAVDLYEQGEIRILLDRAGSGFTGRFTTAHGPSAPAMGWAARALRALVRVYQWTLAPVLGANCRYAPSCSEYAKLAIRAHGPLQGTALAARRARSGGRPWAMACAVMAWASSAGKAAPEPVSPTQ